MEDVSASATKVPGARRRLVSLEKLEELVDQMRVAVPKDIMEAEEVLQRRDDILSQSLVEARRIRATAESEYRSRIDESELVKKAEEEGARVVEEAQQKAQRILDETDTQASALRAGADQYAQATLQKLEEELTQVINTIRNGIQVMDAQQESTT